MSRLRLALALVMMLGGIALPMVAAASPAVPAAPVAQNVLPATPIPGGQGTDTALPPTDSAVTVNGRGTFADLEITVNQTTDLANQAISITWTGGNPTRESPGTFSDNYLQIMQCWGDDDGTVPGNPGPPPEQCVFGAVGSISIPPTSVYPSSYAISRIIGIAGQTEDLSEGVSDGDGFYYRAFRAVDGTEIGVHTDPDFIPGVSAGNSWLNPYFNATTTNEIPGAKTDSAGRGSELFEVHTGLQSAGLGCGQRTLEVGDELVAPQCWLVIVPRGDSLTENAGTSLVLAGPAEPVGTPPLRRAAWQNRIAIPLDFLPIESPCSLDDEERRLAGSDLMQAAIASWQPVLCTTADLPPYSFVPVGDGAARQQLSSSAEGGPGMVVVSKPLEPAQTDPLSPAVYAPVGLSGLVIGFNVERYVRSEFPEEAAYSGMRVARLNLTPRLVAKLLTQSYRSQVSVGGPPPADYEWVAGNPRSMATDPDFVQFNPEFEMLRAGDERTFGGLQLPAGSSDAAETLWAWVLADDEARDWLDGAADEWGMLVNPAYSTSPDVNPNGFGFGSPLPNNFPKADPYCYQAPPTGFNGSIVPPPLCGTDWMPYGRNYAETARAARIGFDGARILENINPVSSSEYWRRISPQYVGLRAMLSLTDSASAAQYGLQVAALSRADDNGDDRVFIAPDDAGLQAGAAAMAPSAVDPDVLVVDPSADAPSAYPLTLLSYAAIKPLSLDDAGRNDYAEFVEYAVVEGQVAGVEVGRLPRGYAPLPASMVSAALAAAETIRTLPPVPTTTLPPTTLDDSGIDTGGSSDGGSGLPTPDTTAEPTDTGVSTTTTTSTTVPVSSVPSTSVAQTTVTPSVGGASGRYAVYGLGVTLAGTALGALEITKRPRRRPRSSGDAGSGIGTDSDEALDDERRST